ncbi:MAG: DUF3179 domain-containing protein [Deltaproteobacteria bacterium]|nr:DUF3179 domain-containing protein [Candidatus Zymogenaceae bacterium]
MNGRRLTFYTGGLSDGLIVIRDRETRSFWNHITGVCIKGELTGERMTLVPLLHTTVTGALKRYPAAHLAYSRQTLFQRLMSFFIELNRVYVGRFTLPFLKKTLTTIDTRRPSWELGLGVWMEEADGSVSARYYPIKTIRRLERSGRGLIDVLSGRKLLICLDSRNSVPGAIMLTAPGAREATIARREGTEIVLDSGAEFIGGDLFDAEGAPLFAPRPMQLYARWYGFAATFPGCDIYEA